jgi:hypothetical protein
LRRHVDLHGFTSSLGRAVEPDRKDAESSFSNVFEISAELTSFR